MSKSLLAARVLALLWALPFAAQAEAQIAVQPTPLSSGPVQVTLGEGCSAVQLLPAEAEAVSKGPVTALNDRFQSGDWKAALRVAKHLLDQTRCDADPAAAVAANYRTSHVWLTWVGDDVFENRGVRRMLVHDAAAPYKLDLPGITRVYEVFVSDRKASTLIALVTSTEKADPTLEQIPAVVAKILPALFGLAATIGQPVQPGGRTPAVAGFPPPPSFWATPFQIDLPARRASLAIKAIAGELTSPEEFRRTTSKYALTVGFRTSACALELAEANSAAAAGAYESGACTPVKGEDPMERTRLCLAAFDGALRSGLTTLHDGARCSTDAETKAMAAVDEQFRTLLTSGVSREVTTEITVANTPRQRVSFGLVEAVAFAAKLQDPRVKLTGNGTVQADPLPRLLTIVTVNTSFRGYDASAITASPQEKVRWFAGAVVLPDFGVAAGLSFLPIRGVSVNGGIAGLFVKSAAANAIGSQPKDATDPFRLGTAWAAFLGVGYNFK